MNIFKEFLRQLFSSQCQLTSLRLDIVSYHIGYDTDDCMKLFSHSLQNSISNECQSFCTTLSHLYIHIRYAYFLEQLIEHIPAIEKLSVKFNRTLDIEPRSMSFIETLRQANGNLFNKRFQHQITILNDGLLNSQPIAKQNYISRKCVATNKIIAEKDHAAVQLDIADEVDEQTGRITRKTSTYTLTDSVRMMLVADDSIARLVTRDEFINNGYFFKDTK
ncbi:unnamed protein product [Rotaria sp. Silwood1]|nr:unnamed protein product [Rotaria sp. Silwood1]CAF3815384.1 unnamed protein product [Rotaria sp. Silwood1]CAF4766752.1 unnamed protein product [Rotaria sp. Silwood1]CAF4882099.1 unnamed protein product [Rotaria sp. Silwood1]